MEGPVPEKFTSRLGEVVMESFEEVNEVVLADEDSE
jgi:hypothetical protein